jgi:hypothetical protein
MTALTPEAVGASLTKAQRRLVEVCDSPANARTLASRIGYASGHWVGHFARRSPLFTVRARETGHVAVWQLTPLGKQVRELLSRDPAP